MGIDKLVSVLNNAGNVEKNPTRKLISDVNGSKGNLSRDLAIFLVELQRKNLPESTVAVAEGAPE